MAGEPYDVSSEIESLGRGFVRVVRGKQRDGCCLIWLTTCLNTMGLEILYPHFQLFNML